MADDIDRAAELEAWSRERALDPQHERAGFAAQAEWERRSAKWCAEPACGELIPDQRRRTLPGVQRCVTCQETKERRTRT